MARNQLFLIARHYSSGMLLKNAWPILIAQLLWGLVALRHGRGCQWLRGKAEGLSRFAEFRDSASSERDPMLAQILRSGEQEIHRVQQAFGRDLYWTLYFLLTAGSAK